jgi:hypothetical protein
MRNFARTTTGGAAMLSATAVGIRVAAAQTKASQKAVGYQDRSKRAQQCDNCRQFAAPASCKVVKGDIVRAGWWKMYVKNRPNSIRSARHRRKKWVFRTQAAAVTKKH